VKPDAARERGSKHRNAQNGEYKLLCSPMIKGLAHLAIFFVGLIVVEIVLQFHFRIINSFWIWAHEDFQVPFVEQINTPRAYRLRPGFSDSEKGINIDSEGFRSLGSCVVSANKSPTIAFLGDSVPFGFGVRDEHSLPSQFANKIKLKGETYHVLNAGVPAYTMWQSIDRLREDIVPFYHPSLIVLHAANDVSLVTYFQSDWTPSVTWKNVGFLKSFSPLPWISKSATVFYLRSASQRFSQSAGSPTGKYEAERSHMRHDYRPMLQHVTEEVSRLAEWCEEQQIPLVLVALNPFYYQTKNTHKNPTLRLWKDYYNLSNLWSEMFTEVNTVLRNASERYKNVYFCDLRPRFDEQDRDSMYIDFIHFNNAGNHFAAEELLQFLDQRKIMPQTIDSED